MNNSLQILLITYRLWCVRLAVLSVLILGGGGTVGAIDFEELVEPILKAHCIDCHGPDEQEASFRVDRLARLLRGGESGEPAVIPRSPEKSFLMKVVRHEEPGYEMPPDGQLSNEEIEILEQWILEGAETPRSYGPAKEEIKLSHWAFLPLKPTDADDLDEFVQARLRAENLLPSRRADRANLIRRLYLIMLGIPPTPEETKAFVEDKSEDAWGTLVNQVLDSPLYGERFASLWLDLIRFGETNGYETNRERPTAWPFRDWVIDCFNRDMPYDEFVRSQVAGDSYGEPMGTGFLVAGPVDIVKGQDPKLGLVQRMNELDDMINTVGTAFLGLTTGCARCHDHKFDPISQTDYYALQAIFAGVNHGNATLPLTDQEAKTVKELQDEVLALQGNLKKFKPALRSRGLVRVLDDRQAVTLSEPKGFATDVAGSKSQWTGEGYSWWNHSPGKPVLRYEPNLSGTFRIWLSWGAGFSSHTTQASYRLVSASGEKIIAKVNQQLLADGTGVDESGKITQKKMWSGFYDAGLHHLTPEDVITLSGGDSEAVTADVIVLEEVDLSVSDKSVATKPNLRQHVTSGMNTETFTSRPAKAVRFWIDRANQSEACIDELEVFAGEENVALAKAGAIASSSGDFVHPKHKLSQINDGEYGNDRSWISAQLTGGWVQIDFPQIHNVDRIVWARDRTGKYSDRTALEYRVELQDADGVWQYVAGSSDRRSVANQESDEQHYDFENFPEEEAKKAREWLAEIEQIQVDVEQIQSQRVAYVGQFTQPGATHRLYRGEPTSPREQVVPAGIEALTDLKLDADSAEKERRRALAEWITDDTTSLTSRVIVNRIWQFHFGEGIVSTPSDFGRNGAKPTHPQLIDWLANELIASNWSLKHIHRLILLSDTWCQSHEPNSQALQVDAGNRLLWRFAPRRLDAETIRDSILYVSGVLDLDNRGGKGFSAFEVQMENVRHYHPKEIYGPEDWRRMIYMTKVRQEKDQVFGVFDCPDASMVVAKRSRSTTPLQALSLLNSSFVLQQSELFADRIVSDKIDPHQRVTRAWQLCYQRDPGEREIRLSLELVDQYGWKALTRALLNSNEFVFIP